MELNPNFSDFNPKGSHYVYLGSLSNQSGHYLLFISIDLSLVDAFDSIRGLI